MKCVYCEGKGTLQALVNRGDEGCAWESITCIECHGSGSISDERRDELLAAEKMRKDRKARGLSLREEAARLGITPAELSRREFAR